MLARKALFCDFAGALFFYTDCKVTWKGKYHSSASDYNFLNTEDTVSNPD
jgi:hypothetical protein